MRKIFSKEEEAKRTRRNQFLIGGAMVLIMVASVLGYAFSRDTNTSNSDSIVYNGLQFVQQSGFWGASIGNAQFSFSYNPTETGKINSILTLNPINNYFNKPLYISSENTEAATEISRNLFYQNSIVQRVQDACLQGENCNDSNLPVKTCDDNLIVIKDSNSTGITQKQNCVFIEGNDENLTMMSDEFLFKILGITQ